MTMTTENLAAALRALQAAQAAGVDICMITAKYSSKGYYCSFERKEDGLEIRGSESADNPASAIVMAWEKFENLAKRGAPRLLGGLLEGGKAAKEETTPPQDMPGYDYNDNISF